MKKIIIFALIIAMLVPVVAVNAEYTIPAVFSRVIIPGETWSVLVPTDQFIYAYSQECYFPINPSNFAVLNLSGGPVTFDTISASSCYFGDDYDGNKTQFVFTTSDHSFSISNVGKHPVSISLTWDVPVTSIVFIPIISNYSTPSIDQ